MAQACVHCRASLPAEGKHKDCSVCERALCEPCAAVPPTLCYQCRYPIACRLFHCGAVFRTSDNHDFCLVCGPQVGLGTRFLRAGAVVPCVECRPRLCSECRMFLLVQDTIVTKDGTPLCASCHRLSAAKPLGFLEQRVPAAARENDALSLPPTQRSASPSPSPPAEGGDEMVWKLVAFTYPEVAAAESLRYDS